MNSRFRQHCYALLALAGIAVTWYFNIQFIMENGGFSLTKYVSDNYINSASSSIANDIIIVACVFFVWSYHEAKRLAIPHWWLYVVMTFGVAIAFSMPLFLWVRERRIEALKMNEIASGSPMTNDRTRAEGLDQNLFDPKTAVSTDGDGTAK